MRLPLTLAGAIVLATIAPNPALSQSRGENRRSTGDATETRTGQSLSGDEQLSLIAAALDARVRRSATPDCSHLVHAIYEEAGFPYAYAPSNDLYAGIDEFRRISHPEPGDLVVWRGHVGLVIKPSQHIFFSFMTSGPGTDDYQSAYWKHRGKPRFYRYVKTSCDDCAPRRSSNQLLKINKDR